MSRSTRRLAQGLAGCVLAAALAGPAAALDRLVFDTGGVNGALRSGLERASLLFGLAAQEAPRPQEVMAAARADYKRLVGALYEAGHYGGTVSILVDGREAAGISPLSPPTRIGTVTVRVDPGPAFALGAARVVPPPPGADLPDVFVTGAPARLGVLRDAARAGIDGWRDLGHAKAEVAGERITANHATSTLDAEITLDPGPRLRFGGLDFAGDTGVRPERLRQIAGFPEGAVFSPDDLDRVTSRLRRTGVFSAVALDEAEAANPDGTLDITATLADRLPRRFGAGVEISSTEGASLSAYWMHRNLLGGAERLRFDAEIGGIAGESGGIDYALGARLTRPATFTPDTSAYLDLDLSREDEPDFVANGIELGAGVEHVFSDRLSGSAGLGLKFADTVRATGPQDFLLLTVPLSLAWDGRDDVLDAMRGVYLAGEATPFLGLSGSDSGARLTLDARGYLPLGDRFVLAGRAQLGSVLGATLAGTPPDFLFHSGGGGTVRGHGYQSLAVDLGNGATSGGRSLAVFSLEARAKVTGPFGVVAFADFGLVGPNSLPDAASGSHAGAGLGVRYDTGIGPIRLDVATPVSGPSAGSAVQVYLGIGQSF